jgi:hypothetical protein
VILSINTEAKLVEFNAHAHAHLNGLNFLGEENALVERKNLLIK